MTCHENIVFWMTWEHCVLIDMRTLCSDWHENIVFFVDIRTLCSGCHENIVFWLTWEHYVLGDMRTLCSGWHENIVFWVTWKHCVLIDMRTLCSLLTWEHCVLVDLRTLCSGCHENIVFWLTWQHSWPVPCSLFLVRTSSSCETIQRAGLAWHFLLHFLSLLDKQCSALFISQFIRSLPSDIEHFKPFKIRTILPLQ